MLISLHMDNLKNGISNYCFTFCIHHIKNYQSSHQSAPDTFQSNLQEKRGRCEVSPPLLFFFSFCWGLKQSSCSNLFVEGSEGEGQHLQKGRRGLFLIPTVVSLQLLLCQFCVAYKISPHTELSSGSIGHIFSIKNAMEKLNVGCTLVWRIRPSEIFMMCRLARMLSAFCIQIYFLCKHARVTSSPFWYSGVAKLI